MNKESKLRLGVVGFGKLGLLHAAILDALPNCELTALVDNSSTMLSFFSEWKPNVKCYGDHSEMLRDAAADAVVIATPTHLHVPIAMDCIAKGLPVFIEKPLSTTSEQARPLMDLLRKAKVPTMVGYMNRYHDTFHAAQNILRSGALGRPQSFKATMYISQLMEPGKGWRYDKAKAGGGVLITQNSHLLDLLLWFFGDIEWVSGHTQTLYSNNVEDAVHCYLKFENGLSGFVDTSWSARHQRTLTTNIELQAERGTLGISDDEVRLFLDEKSGKFPAGWTTLKKPDLFRGVSFDVGGPHYTRQLEVFVEAVRNGKPKVDADLSDVDSAFRVQSVIDAIYRSAESDGMRVAIGS